MNEEITRFENELEQETSNQDENLQEELPQEDSLVEELPEEAADSEELPEELIDSEELPEEVTDSEELPTKETPEDPLAEIMKTTPYHEKYYLQYCGGKRTTPIDIKGTKEFLDALGFEGGELRRAREGKGQAEVFQSSDKNKKNQMYCSYCGAEIAGVEYYRMQDGRFRCSTCSRSIVSDREEIQAMCKRVISNMEHFFGATINVPIDVEVLEERKLKRKVGAPLGTRDSRSMLILGVSINKKKKYSILIENGAPKISLIATFAHELTHIWQYIHWDNVKQFKKCPKKNRLLIYEGMAKWAEIQYLYLIGEVNVAKREEYITRNRQDEYGSGFCLYEEHYPLAREAMTCTETPFKPDHYPFE